ncbi:SpoIIE family protein phosphatase [Salipaludibacillus agaradhaerens]|uniref:SpoIIE family protein phosphatase n=1 Tax=Salipaludibacillus agaradhaerens TaxID=76935 RepID=UPI0021518443|nr:SpoIIE family protein phosphatase [Salipaludibacillus agaradhaerens]MCR6105355.1 SpoIIE family protein phosphatase [Salipaludibacillus agaradhaerens]MCR6117396.1 SpoIIE family protein phosphatase [Salipaludibacillus agaradhaerens]
MIEHHHLKEMDVSIYKVAKKGNWCSGDSFYTIRTENYILCAMADGLGSGEEAMNAAEIAMDVIKNEHELDTGTIMDKCNQKMGGTRGVVLTILKFDFTSKMIDYTNVGNISCIFYDPTGKLFRPVPVRGYLSGKRMKYRTQRIPFSKDVVFIMYSDGLAFNPNDHKIFARSEIPEQMMTNLLDNKASAKDDTTILIGKVN